MTEYIQSKLIDYFKIVDDERRANKSKPEEFEEYFRNRIDEMDNKTNQEFIEDLSLKHLNSFLQYLVSFEEITPNAIQEITTDIKILTTKFQEYFIQWFSNYYPYNELLLKFELARQPLTNNQKNIDATIKFNVDEIMKHYARAESFTEKILGITIGDDEIKKELEEALLTELKPDKDHFTNLKKENGHLKEWITIMFKNKLDQTFADLAFFNASYQRALYIKIFTTHDKRTWIARLDKEIELLKKYKNSFQEGEYDKFIEHIQTIKQAIKEYNRKNTIRPFLDEAFQNIEFPIKINPPKISRGKKGLIFFSTNHIYSNH